MLKQRNEAGVPEYGMSLLRCLAALCLVFSAPVLAQDDDDAEDETIYTLSPFKVEASKGYRATSTLAGTRLRTDLSEVGASISVLTEQFIQDVAADDAGSLLIYSANTEVGGILGNYSSGADVQIVDTEQARRDTQNAQRVRGLINAELTREYFRTRIPFDSYNTSTVTVNRGPNSVLFGLGSPGGIIEHSVRKPIVGSDFTELSVRIDDQGAHRESIDVNRTFFDGRLGLRFAALNEDAQYQQEPAFERDSRVFMSWSAELFENENSEFLGSTRFEGNVEYGKIYGTPPDVIPPGDGFSGWWEGMDAGLIFSTVAGVDSVADYDPRSIPQQFGGAFIPKHTIDNLNRTGVGNTQNVVPLFVNVPLIYRDATSGPEWIQGLQGGMPRVRYFGLGGRALQDMFVTHFPEFRIAGFTSPVISDRNVFDFVNTLYSGSTNRKEQDFDVNDFSLTQDFLNGNAGIKVDYNEQNYERYTFLPFSSGWDRHVRLDLSQITSIPDPFPQAPGMVSPNSIANPDLGRPLLVAGNFFTDTLGHDTNTIRFTGFIKKDFTELDTMLGRLLGSHTLTGMAEEFEEETLSRRLKLDVESNEVDAGGGDILFSGHLGGRRRLGAIVYLGPSALNANDPSEVRITSGITAPMPYPGFTYDASYWDHGAKEVRTAEFFAEQVNVSGSISAREITSEAFVVNSKFLDDHLITMFAWRDDEVSSFAGIDPAPGNTRFLPDGEFDASLLRLKGTPDSIIPGSTKTESYVLRFPEEHLFELPGNADLRLHYFKSESFEPVAVGRNIFGEIVGNPGGETEEYGFALDLLDRKLSVRVNWYETANSNARTNVSGAFPESVSYYGGQLQAYDNSIIQGLTIDDVAGARAAGFNTWDELIAAVHQIYPEPTRSLLSPQIVNGVVQQNTIVGLTDTFDFVAEGMEVEVVGAITDNWNVAFNLAQQETVQNNTAPAMVQFANQVLENINNLGLTNVQANPHLNQPGTLESTWVTGPLFGVNSTAASDGRQSLEQREWRWNLVSTYTFADGKLDGTMVGAAARWQDKAAIGAPLIFNSEGIVVSDVANPFFGEEEFNMDVWVRFQPKLFKNVDWDVQLNIRNLIGGDEDDVIPVSIDPAGRITTVRMAPDRQILLTNTFKF